MSSKYATSVRNREILNKKNEECTQAKTVEATLRKKAESLEGQVARLQKSLASQSHAYSQTKARLKTAADPKQVHPFFLPTWSQWKKAGLGIIVASGAVRN